MPGFFRTAANKDALALLIIPPAPASYTAEQKAAIDKARQDLRNGFIENLSEWISDGLYATFSTGTPVASDGGAALQIQWKAETI